IIPLPTVTINEPTDGAVVPDTPGTVTIRGTCSGPEPLTIDLHVGPTDTYQAVLDTPTTWSVQNVPLRQLGAGSIGAPLQDGFGRPGVDAKPRSVTLKDVTPPTVTIEQPQGRAWVSNAPLEASGTVADGGSGTASVDWSLDGKTWHPAVLAPDLARWSVRENT